MRINSLIITAIQNELGEFEIDFKNESELLLRFGYWKPIDISVIEMIIPEYFKVTEEGIYDDDCGHLFFYVISNKKYG